MNVQPSPFSNPCFPIELKKFILSKLSPFELILSANRVCREWNDVSNDAMTWKLIESEAQSGNLETIRQLALIYLVGKSRPRDEEEGFALAEMLADQISSRELVSSQERLLFGLARARTTNSENLVRMIGEAYSDLPGIKSLLDESNPFALYLESIANLSDPSRQGQGIANLVSSAHQNFKSALYALSFFDPTQLEELAKLKTPEAQFFTYLIAKNTDALSDEALKGLVESAESNFALSQFALAMHLKGEGKINESLKWALKAAMQGHIQAQYFIGQQSKCLEIDLSSDERAWILEAAQAGENEIYFHLGKISVENLKCLEKIESKWFETIDLSLDIPLFQWTYFPYFLSMLYKNGHGVQKCEKKALEYYNQLKNMDPGFAEQLKEYLDTK